MIKKYFTVSGDTWDAISFKVYGVESHMQDLFIANQHLADVLVFDAGISIAVPEVIAASSAQVPPWLAASEIEAARANVEIYPVQFRKEPFSYRWAERFTRSVKRAAKLGL